MPESIEGYVHIPGIQLAPGRAITVGSWTLRPVSFAEWLALEDPALVAVERAYTGVSPVFLIGPVAVDDSMRDDLLIADWSRQLFTAAQQVNHALLLTLGEILPDPRRSAMYLRFPPVGQENSISVFGPNERELLLIDYSPYVAVPEERERDLCAIFSKFAAIGLGEKTPEVLRLIDAIRLVRRPKTHLLDFIVYFVMVHEDIFNAAATKPLGQTFARRLAALFSNDFDRLAEWREAFGQLYKVRSDALHGRDPAPGLAWLAGRFTQLERFLIESCYRTCSLTAYLATLQHPEAVIKLLLHRLDGAQDSREVYDAIHAEPGLNWLLA